METINMNQFNALLGAVKSIERIGNQNAKICVCENGSALLSYDTLCAAFINGRLYVTNYHNFSTTTSRHVNKYCRLTAKERMEALKTEEITYIEGAKHYALFSE